MHVLFIDWMWEPRQAGRCANRAAVCGVGVQYLSLYAGDWGMDPNGNGIIKRLEEKKHDGNKGTV